MILQNRGVSYKQQAEYSFVNWPFSIKLLWAPIVDSVFISSMGRRKTWLVPVQYTLGLCMIFYSFFVESHLGETAAHQPNVAMLTIMFFGLNFLAATQDIAVDGWALTMLDR
jgi:PAT family acetyl-CoA transporter-like MFS transporter 1